MAVLNYLSPGTEIIVDPSCKTHETTGLGFPCAEHEIWLPLSLLKVSLDKGSCKKIGAWTLLSIRDAAVRHIRSESLNYFYDYDL